jgi:MFS family permease
VADATTVVRWVQTIPPATLHALNDRVVELVRQARVTRGRTLRSAATTIHHPTDSSLLADGGRVLCSISRRRKPLVALPVLVSTRALAGLGAAIISGSSFAAVSDAFPVAVRDNRVIGLLLSVVGIAAVIGIPILTQIASVSGWRVAAAALNILL